MSSGRWLMMALLAVLTVFFSLQTLRTWREPLQVHRPAATERDKFQPLASPSGKQNKLSRSAYDVIATRSLFDQNRTEGSDDASIANLKPAEASRQAKRIILYGVVVNAGEKKALVSSDGVRRGGEDFMWVRIGEMIERLKVAAIQSDRILVQENGSHYEILLNDQRSPGRPARAIKSAGPTVISAGGEAEHAQESGPGKTHINPDEAQKQQNNS